MGGKKESWHELSGGGGKIRNKIPKKKKVKPRSDPQIERESALVPAIISH